MKLQDYINQLMGKTISISILNSNLFPFGFKERDSMMTLKEHSKGFYMIMINETCIYMVNTKEINSYKVEMLDEEISVIEWKDIRIVSLDNI